MTLMYLLITLIQATFSYVQNPSLFKKHRNVTRSNQSNKNSNSHFANFKKRFTAPFKNKFAGPIKKTVTPSIKNKFNLPFKNMIKVPSKYTFSLSNKDKPSGYFKIGANMKTSPLDNVFNKKYSLLTSGKPLGGHRKFKLEKLPVQKSLSRKNALAGGLKEKFQNLGNFNTGRVISKYQKPKPSFSFMENSYHHYGDCDGCLL